MKRINIVTLILVFTSLLFTNCNTAKRTSMSVAQIERITPIQAKPIIDTAHFSYTLPKQLPPKITDTKHDFQLAYQELKAMLQGTQPPDFERAVYLSENPYHNNQYTYKQFQQMVDIPLSAIQALIAVNDKSDTMNFDVKVSANGTFKMADMRFLPKEKKELYKKTLGNWAIFTYITDTLTFRVGDSRSPFLLYHLPFAYTTEDPFGKKDWTSTQVINLLTNGEQGNCYSLTALFKILSNRLHTDTRLCTAPQHVYIQHRDTKGDYYNIELATAGFPRDGTLQTLTYTTDEAIKNGIALRDYTERQSIGLCMVNLAKSYEHYYETKDDEFLMQCAETVLLYDSLNLSALLLKEQVLDEQVNQYAKQKNISNITLLKQDKNIASTISNLEQHTNLLYRLGYRQMPVDMQQIILSGNYPTAFADQNPSPYSNPRISKEEKLGKYQALYGGLFKEVFEQQASEEYRHFVFDTKTKKLKSINTATQENELIDPVAFAYDFGARMYDARLGRWIKTDKLEYLYTSLSPYNFVANNPILLCDADGNRIQFNMQDQRHKSNTEFATMLTNMFDKQVLISISNNTGYLSIDKIKDVSKLSNQQYAMYKYIEHMVSDDIDVQMKTTKDDASIGIDDFSNYIIDIGDLNNTKRKMNWVLHFFSEQYNTQKDNPEFFNTPYYLRAEKFYIKSHIKALNTELELLGERVGNELYSNSAFLAKMSNKFQNSSETFDNLPRAYILPIVNDCNEVVKYEMQIENPSNGEFKSIIYDKDSEVIKNYINNPQFTKESNINY